MSLYEKNAVKITHNTVLWHLVAILWPPFSFDLPGIDIKGYRFVVSLMSKASQWYMGFKI